MNTVFAIKLVRVEVDWLLLATQLVILGKGLGLIHVTSMLTETGFGGLLAFSQSKLLCPTKVSFLIYFKLLSFLLFLLCFYYYYLFLLFLFTVTSVFLELRIENQI